MKTMTMMFAGLLAVGVAGAANAQTTGYVSHGKYHQTNSYQRGTHSGHVEHGRYHYDRYNHGNHRGYEHHGYYGYRGGHYGRYDGLGGFVAGAVIGGLFVAATTQPTYQTSPNYGVVYTDPNPSSTYIQRCTTYELADGNITKRCEWIPRGQ